MSKVTGRQFDNSERIPKSSDGKASLRLLFQPPTPCRNSLYKFLTQVVVLSLLAVMEMLLPHKPVQPIGGQQALLEIELKSDSLQPLSTCLRSALWNNTKLIHSLSHLTAFQRFEDSHQSCLCLAFSRMNVPGFPKCLSQVAVSKMLH